MNKEILKQNDETEKVEIIQDGEVLANDLLEEIQGGAAAAGECCNVNNGCYGQTNDKLRPGIDEGELRVI